MKTTALPTQVSVAPIALTDLAEQEGRGKPLVAQRFDLIKNLKVALHIRVGQSEITVDELMALKDGSIVKFNQLVNEPMELMLDSEVIARGELVAVGDSLGFKVSEVCQLNAGT